MFIYPIGKDGDKGFGKASVQITITHFIAGCIFWALAGGLFTGIMSYKDLKNALALTQKEKEDLKNALASLTKSNARSHVLRENFEQDDDRGIDMITNTLGMKFIYIPPMAFMMGSPKKEDSRGDNETQHEVTLTRGFYMQTTEVTQGQWQAIMGDYPSKFKSCGTDCPVENVSWYDVQKFIKRLNKKESDTQYRLPTEAEWEYAARAGTATPFSFGNTLSTDQANYDGNYPYGDGPKGIFRKKTIPVASFAPNGFGLYDMHGNVWEWCQDWYGDYPTESVTDPKGPSYSSGRVIRGGSWSAPAGYCRAAFRDWNDPGFYFNILGFRLACLPGQHVNR